MSNVTFYKFIDRKNKVGRVLLANFLAVQKVMGPILNREVGVSGRRSGDGDSRIAERIRGHQEWVEGIWGELTEDGAREWKGLMEWPRRIFSE